VFERGYIQPICLSWLNLGYIVIIELLHGRNQVKTAFKMITHRLGCKINL